MVTDPIADFLTRIRNAQMANHRIVEIPASNLKKRMTEILYDKGYILKYKFEDDTKQGVIKIALKYDPDYQGTGDPEPGKGKPSRSASVCKPCGIQTCEKRTWVSLSCLLQKVS